MFSFFFLKSFLCEEIALQRFELKMFSEVMETKNQQKFKWLLRRNVPKMFHCFVLLTKICFIISLFEKQYGFI